MLNKIVSSPLLNFTKYLLFPSSLLITLFFALGIQGSPFSKHVQAEGEIEIHTQEDLAAITDAPNASYILMANIDLAEHSDFYIPTFGGVFDGNGFEISHLTLSLGPLVEKAGLFGELSAGGTIKSLGVVDINITGGKRYIGGIIGYNYGTVTNSYTTGVIVGSTDSVGGIIGFNSDGSTLRDSYSTATVTGASNVGGLVGYNWAGEITSSHWEGIIEGDNHTGGLIGYNEEGDITNCYTTGEVNGTEYSSDVGGLVGTHSALGTTEATGIIQNSYSEATVTGYYNVGGLVGLFEGEIASIIQSHAAGAVTAGGYIGGLIGQAVRASNIEASFATGNVTGDSYVGGLIGYNDCLTMSDLYASGDVTGDSYVGGLIGYNDSLILSNSYALGGVTDTGGDGGAIGGLIGTHYGGTVNNCYSAGVISSLVVEEDDVGGLIGTNYETRDEITNSFWDTETSTITISLGGTGKTTAQMKSISTFNDTATEGLNATWDIVEYKSFNPPASNIWFIEDTFDYAHLYYEYEDYVPSQQGGDPEITTSPATNVTSTSAKLNALLTDLGTYNTVYVYFRYKAASEGIWIESSQVDKALTGSYSYELMSLIPETIYQYSSAANFGETGVVYGDTLSFTTIASAVEEPPVEEPPVEEPPVDEPPAVVPPVIVPPVVEPPVDVPPEETFEPIKDCTNADETITVNVGDTFKLSITFGSGSPYRPYSPGYDSNVLKLLDYSDITEEQKTSPNSGIAPITIGDLMQRVYTFEAISLTDNTCTLVELGLSHVHNQADKKEKKIIAVFINDGIIGDGTPPDDDSSVEEDPLPPEDEGENIFTKIGKSIRKFAEKAVKTISDIKIDKKTATAVGTIGYAAATASHIILNFVTFTGSNSVSALQLLSSLFVIGALKRRKQKYGIVYDSVTKEPISMAIVRVLDTTGKLVATLVTDVYGVFDLDLQQGQYRFEVVSRDHIFPSSAALGPNDLPYQNVYKGGVISYIPNQSSNISIPMDREDKGLIAKALASSKSLLMGILNIIFSILFVLGFAMTIISLAKEPSTLSRILLALYVLSILVLIYLRAKETSSYGRVATVDGTPVEGIEIGLRELEFDTLYAKRVSNENGKYRFILPKGKYRLESLNDSYVFVGLKENTFQVEEGKLYILGQDLVVKRIQ